MKIYTFYTPSHKIYFDNYFAPTFPRNELELEIAEFPQECPSGDFNKACWKLTMRRKVEYVIKGIEDCWGDCFIHADADVQFFGNIQEPLLAELGDHDAAFQDDVGDSRCCAGFFICRANSDTKDLFEAISENLEDYKHDQAALNALKDKIRWKCLSHRFYTIAQDTGTLYQGDNQGVMESIRGNPHAALNNPDTMLVHHANWAIGRENKIKSLDFVKAWIHENNKAR